MDDFYFEKIISSFNRKFRIDIHHFRLVNIELLSHFTNIVTFTVIAVTIVVSVVCLVEVLIKNLNFQMPFQSPTTLQEIFNWLQNI